MQERRNTRQRQLVLGEVLARCDHPTAEDVWEAVHEEDPHVSRATVYRNLHVLAECGQIQSVRMPEGERFDRRLDGHAHLVCTRCGRVADGPAGYDEATDRAASEATGWAIERHSLIFDGLCPECRAAAAVAGTGGGATGETGTAGTDGASGD